MSIIDKMLRMLGLIRKSEAERLQCTRDQRTKEFISKLATAAKVAGVNVMVERDVANNRDFHSDVFLVDGTNFLNHCRLLDGAKIIVSPLASGNVINGCVFVSKQWRGMKFSTGYSPSNLIIGQGVDFSNGAKS